MDMVWTSIGLPTYPSSAIGIAAFLIATIVGGSILTGIVTSALGIGSYWPPGERNWNYYVPGSDRRSSISPLSWPTWLLRENGLHRYTRYMR